VIERIRTVLLEIIALAPTVPSTSTSTTASTSATSPFDSLMSKLQHAVSVILSEGLVMFYPTPLAQTSFVLRLLEQRQSQSSSSSPHHSRLTSAVLGEQLQTTFSFFFLPSGVHMHPSLDFALSFCKRVFTMTALTTVSFALSLSLYCFIQPSSVIDPPWHLLCSI
jgi:hypothetical protein